MKRVLLIGIFIQLSLTGMCQYIPNSSQSFHFAPNFNPAFTGIEGYQDLKLGYRYQWAGLGDGAPKFINASFNFRLKEPLDLTLNAIRTSMAKKQNNEIPKLKRIIHGLGVNVFNEEENLINRIGGGVNYSFHYPLGKDLRLAVGVNATLYNSRVDVNKIYLGKNPDGSPIVISDDGVIRELQAGSSFTNLNVRAGFLVYASRYYVGFSYLPILNKGLNNPSTGIDDIETAIGSPNVYRAVIQGGYSFPVSATMDIKPSVLALMQIDNTFLIDYNVKVYIQEKIWFGVTYRDVKSMIGMLGFNLNEKLGASYSYELSGGNARQFLGGSHELVLSVRLNNFKRQLQQTW
ncbi:type IX secretion system membrane protein PorP/SprF [Chryseolinea sp. H1M3-3]|jgi:type IX secretion system PorP/SprF family membrane protein|uniref:PorP/SprF family type IX secretion system membrane protein n=1 Tax=Chryseolinea sp. H1M3-3 TaxID=3034144 RepID=UPI0023EC8449|nr:type IX secretion system membrane protein PorP/SprF [Chryseolinea sp. H1M3-3]